MRFDNPINDHGFVFPDIADFPDVSNEDRYMGNSDAEHIAKIKDGIKYQNLKDFEEGYEITDDNLNLGIHEFMLAMQLESRQSKDIDALRFTKQFQNILVQLTDKELKVKLDETPYFRAYAFTNQYEFMAVLAEYFIESPMEFKTHFPNLYNHTQKLLNFTFAGY